MPGEAKRPWWGTIDFTFAAAGETADAEEPMRIVEAVYEAVEKVTGIPTEGGSFGAMESSDVIPDSPLDKRLKR